ncbi:MAG: hypothetical protein ACUBOA_00525 [Candidatus Loosdrechtia sp.]|uniref:hypothetical protein n=1 Tax=Candidatus Loosdrechtia sp. TaxID=3101272 RepID=UPI003A6AD073|nr:MAG: hypothetical protein QY305_13575 [Candidatus Jettenia sp. AMX2]
MIIVKDTKHRLNPEGVTENTCFFVLYTDIWDIINPEKCHCEERSDEAISRSWGRDCFRLRLRNDGRWREGLLRKRPSQ